MHKQRPNRIFKSAALGLRKGKTPVILVTKDIVVRVKAQMLGIQAEDFTTEQAPISEEHRPVRGLCSGKEIRGL